MNRDKKMARRIIREIIEKLTDRYGDPVMAAVQYEEELEYNAPSYEDKLADRLRRYARETKQ